MPTHLVAQAVAIMGLVSASRFVESIYRSAIVGLEHQVLFNAVNSFMATLRFLGALGILAWVSPTIDAFFLWQGVVSILTLGVLATVTYTSLPQGDRRGQFSLSALRGIWRFAGGMVAFTFSALLFTTIDKILLSRMLSLSDFGYYSLAVSVASSLFLLVGPITTAFYPRFCKLYAEGSTLALADSFHKGAQMVSVFAGSAAMVLIFFSRTFLQLWTQDDELASRLSELLSLLVLGNLIGTINWIPYQMQLAHGWTSLSVYLTFCAALIIATLMLWLVPALGMLGAAYILLTVGIVYHFLLINLMFRRIMTVEKWRWLTRDVMAPLIASGLTVGLIKAFWPAQETMVGQIMTLVIAVILSLSTSILTSQHVRGQVVLVSSILLTKLNVKLNLMLNR